MIRIFINDKEYKINEYGTVADALDLVMGMSKRGIAVALNNDVLPMSEWNVRKLNDGDRITIIKAFYGG
ncbi:MAG: sulfur carrier protein ThiS [Muribaculaceae bacterium]